MPETARADDTIPGDLEDVHTGDARTRRLCAWLEASGDEAPSRDDALRAGFRADEIDTVRHDRAIGADASGGLVNAEEGEQLPEPSIDLTAEFGNGVYFGRGVVVEGGAKIGNNVVLNNGAHVAAGATIGDNALLANCEIGPRCTIGEGATIKGSTLERGVEVAPGSQIAPGVYIEHEVGAGRHAAGQQQPNTSWREGAVRLEGDAARNAARAAPPRPADADIVVGRRTGLEYGAQVTTARSHGNDRSHGNAEMPRVRIGRDCQIGPAARVEGASTLGDRTTLKTGAVACDTHTGCDVHLGQRVTVRSSTLGDSARAIGSDELIEGAKVRDAHSFIGGSEEAENAGLEDEQQQEEQPRKPHLTVSPAHMRASRPDDWGPDSPAAAEANDTIRIHPSSKVDPQAGLEAGVEISRKAVVGPEVVVGQGARIGPAAIVEAKATIGSNAELSPGVKVKSGAVIGQSTKLHTRSQVGENAMVGNRVVIGWQARVKAEAQVEDGVHVKGLTVCEAKRPPASKPKGAVGNKPEETKPTHDWREELGEVYGVPFKHGKGWGVTVYPTAQQRAILEQRHEAAVEQDDYRADHLKGVDAVSFDSQDRERQLTVTDSTAYGSSYDFDGNERIRCVSVPRIKRDS